MPVDSTHGHYLLNIRLRARLPKPERIRVELSELSDNANGPSPDDGIGV